MSSRSSDGVLRVILVVFAVLVLVPLAMMALAVPMMGGFYYGMHDGGAGWVAGLGLVWLLVLVGGGYLVYRALTRGNGGREDAALEELRVAYARGDLTEEEYEERLEKLERERD